MASKFTKVTKSGKGGTNIPTGSYAARLVAFIHLGTQDDEIEEKFITRDVAWLVWELTAEPCPPNGDHGYLIGERFNTSLHENSTLRKMIEARRGQKYPDGITIDPLDDVAQPVLLSIVNRDERAKITGYSMLPKGMDCPSATYVPFVFHISEYDPKNPPAIPGWVPDVYGDRPIELMVASRELRAAHVKLPF